MRKATESAIEALVLWGVKRMRDNPNMTAHDAALSVLNSHGGSITADELAALIQERFSNK